MEDIIKDLVKIANELDIEGLPEEAGAVDSVIENVVEKPAITRAKAERKVKKALNLADKYTRGVFYHDEGWKGIHDFMNIVQNNVDALYLINTEYVRSRARGEMYLKVYTVRVEQDGFKFDFDLHGSEEGTKGGYQVWALNLRKVKDEL